MTTSPEFSPIPTSQVRWFNEGVFRYTGIRKLPATLSQEAAEINQNEENGDPANRTEHKGREVVGPQRGGSSPEPPARTESLAADTP